MLEHNSSLLTVDLSAPHNYIGADGCAELAAAFRANPTARQLRLEGLKLETTDSGRALAAAAPGIRIWW